jgi:putative phage-type endonuclease
MSALPAHVHQGTDAWKEWRRTRGGASEVAALMGCSPWFPQTPHQLWQVKTGRAEVSENDAMRRGSRLEPAARAFAEDVFGEVFEPQVAERGRIVASLDGRTFDGQCILELKVPMAGDDSDTWRHVEEHSTPPDHYLWQCQQALLASGAKLCRFVVCHARGEEIADAIHCHVLPDVQMHEAIIAAWTAFFAYLDADEPPPLTDRDTRERTDAEWRDAVAAWKEAKAWLDEAKTAEDTARKALIELAGEQTSAGAGVKLTRFWTAGSVDYKAATDGMDLEQYRKPGRWSVRISESEG